MSNTFVPATQQGATPNSGANREYTNEVLVLKPEADKLRFITTRLSGMDKLTEFRIIPSCQDGVIQTALNPQFEHGASIGTLVGPWAYNTEVVDNLGSPHGMTFITAVSGDSQGNMPEERFSPANMIIYKCKWKIKEMAMRVENRMDMEGQPKEWLKYARGKYPYMSLPDPRNAWMVQGLCRVLDGNVFRNASKQAILMPGFVLMFNGELFENMADSIGLRMDTQIPLTPQTCGFGDFISPEGGHTVVFNKFAKADPTQPNKKPKPTYKVQLNVNNKIPLQASHVQNFFRPWDTIMNIPTIEKSIEMLVKALGPDMVDFGLRGTGYEKYLPDTVSGSSYSIPPTVNLKELKDQVPVIGGVSAGGYVAAPTHAPGHPAYTQAPSSDGGYVVSGDPTADQLGGLESTAPVPPAFPNEERPADRDTHGNMNAAQTAALVSPNLDDIPDLPDEGDFGNILSDVHNAAQG